MGSLPPPLLLWGTRPAVIGGLVAVVLWFGFRLSVRVTPEGTRVVRKVAFVVPWSWQTYRQPQTFRGALGDPDSFPENAFNIGPFVVAVIVGGPTLLVSAVARAHSSRPPFR